MEDILIIIFTLYSIRVIICVCILAIVDKWELNSYGIETKKTAVLFAFMPLYMLYLVGKNINEKFEK